MWEGEVVLQLILLLLLILAQILSLPVLIKKLGRAEASLSSSFHLGHSALSSDLNRLRNELSTSQSPPRTNDDPESPSPALPSASGSDGLHDN